MITDDAAYPPLNIPKPIADGVWIVDATPIRAMDVMVVPLRMTIFKLANGELLIYSPTRYRETLRAAIERLGPIKHLVAPSTGHWMFVKEWQEKCPEAKSWAVPELANRKAVREAGIRFDALLGPQPPEEWVDQIEHVMFRGPGYGELDMVHKASGTLVVADTLLQVRASTLPPLSRAMAIAAGICTPIGRAPLQLRALLSAKREANAAAARRMISLAPTRLVPAHGDVIEEGVGEHLRHSLDWLEDGRTVTVGLTLAGIGVLAAAAVYWINREPTRRGRRVRRR